MIPSLVAGEVRTALVDYLATTFGLSDDDVRDHLARFLTDPSEGIFRGPYLRVRTPFRTVDQNWESPLGWLPNGFQPFVHQAAAFERLSTLGGRTPQPTLVTTGTGSGKTECFLMPVLDHCARMRDAGVRGVKAIVLYPMNALASDQAGRIASMVAGERRLNGIRAGLYVGENGGHKVMGDDHLIDDRYTLRDDPPDVLLTNYKMLDFLLLRSEDQMLWAETGPDTLRYVVLDEFHTYDGAQGTDVAMLLRRLGATLGTARPGAPLGDAAPVATSATLGTDPAALVDLRHFAGKVFGVTFDESAVIGETRQEIDESCAPVDPTLPVPSAGEVAALDPVDSDAVVAAFCRREPGAALPADPVDLGQHLLAHPIMRAVLGAISDRPRPLAEAALAVADSVPGWADQVRTDPDSVQAALVRFLALVSTARRIVGDRDRPLFSVESQLWIREVSRLLRTVSVEPGFRWLDSPPGVALTGDDESEPSGPEPLTLPAISCRRCGHSGWMATVSEVDHGLGTKPAAIYEAAVTRAPQVRALLRAQPDDPGVRWLDPLGGQIHDTSVEGAIPVHVTAGEDDARRQSCPACGEPNAVLFVGMAVASLASVSITTLFGSGHVDGDERKLLAFTDSVQDASHRAAFFTGRAHRFNNRSLMAGALRGADDRGLSLADLGDLLIADAGDSPHRRFGLVPPDLLRDPLMRSVWSDEPEAGALRVLADRVGFEVDLEFGLRSRVGRTLEQSVAAAAWVDLDDRAVDLAVEAIRDVVGELPPELADRTDAMVAGYLLGLTERLRTSGAIVHPLLQPYLDHAGKQFFVWGGRPKGLPPFTPDQGRPTFATTAPRGEFDSLAAGTALTWWSDWAARSLGLDSSTGAAVNQRVIASLAATTDAVVATTAEGGSTIYGLDRRAVRAVDIAEDGDLPQASVIRCGHCGTAATVPPARLHSWVGVACRRFRCIGTYVVQDPADGGYYRRLYRAGTARRVVAGEHTGMLGRSDREALETAFKLGTAPDAPNVLTATPTLEMGIDIGDLSAVMLTSVPRNPASYLQRVGRAGRATGNSLVTTFVRSDTHGLYYLAEPEAMLAGAVRPPNCYLEASETLRRQYLAYLVDRVAQGQIVANPMPNQIGVLMRGAYEPGGLFQVLTDASIARPQLVADFLALFGDAVGATAADRLREFASGGIEPYLKDVTGDWFDHLNELGRRRDRLAAAIERFEAMEHRSDEDEDELRSLRGQRAAVVRLLRDHRDEYPLSALERLGMLPNYSLTGDTTTLEATLWSPSADPERRYDTQTLEFTRPAIRALTEFAPGNSFYAGGHRHRVDAVEIGAAKDPLYEWWRLCPDCSYAELEVADSPLPQCPRCGTQRIRDLSARRRVLRLRTSLSSGAEESARVFDESDTRTKVRYTVATLVDANPADIGNAWVLPDRAFGAEFVNRMQLRTFNLGRADLPGETSPVAGREYRIAGFTVCRRCGAVREARNDRKGERPELLHQGWCKVRSGSLPPEWDPLLLVHELVTEAIRFVVPVSMYEVDERLASFKGALLLGIRESLGGSPEHLRVAVADAPNHGGQGRRRFLVLYDQVPGGTGYLAPLADPDSIRGILLAAREAIARCVCRSEGRPACHRCLLGVVDQGEYDLVRRDLARELLDSLLEDSFAPEAVATVGAVNISTVEESELERRFKVALREWADTMSDAVTVTKVPGRGRFEAFELTIRFDGQVFRYRIAEQEGLSSVGNTLPDFVITRMDRSGPRIAVYLDGFQFHASAACNNIAADASKRATVRATGDLVWNLTWQDVEQFHQAVVAQPPRLPPDRALLPHGELLAAKRVQLARGGAFEVDAIQQNPVALLLDVLTRPDLGEWRRAVRSAVTGMAMTAGTAQVDADGLAAALDHAQAATWEQPVELAAGATPVAQVAQAVTPGGLPLSLFLDLADPNAERWTVLSVLDDSETGVADRHHPERWADWLPWSNLLQFLGQPEESTAAVMAGSSRSTDLMWDDLWLRHRAGRAAAPGALDTPDAAGAAAAVAVRELTEDERDELDLLLGDELRDLVTRVVAAGAPMPIVGWELDGAPVEAAWPDRRVAVLGPSGDVPPGWDARPPEEWTPATLIAALEAGR